ncbi:sulfite exporter TauE/SafE family protein [Breznakiella homolactica]|uniref:Sulfite exporter TauE/SafE family protein n=1 Tax=Breznakiella homolactica TaxID=2798577 RepID=A0A7T7XKC0_9SPIR|nr:sulfite exporter TauE/SafE family protein [Breznakiella homolactica]QQO07768.1 sulfite exporter TauE/SafE family protein [Breznakiella homolactica]
MSGKYRTGRLIWAVLGLFLLGGESVWAHIADEISVKTTITLEDGQVGFTLDIASGVLFSTAFLKILDPDRNKVFEEPDQKVFGEFVLDTLKVSLDGSPVRPVLDSFSASQWDLFAAGISSITLDYSIPFDRDGGEAVMLEYEISFYPETAVYSLSVINSVPEGLAITGEERNEFLQDLVRLSFTGDPETVAALAAAAPPADLKTTDKPPAAKASAKLDVSGILAFFQEGAVGGSALGLILVLAVVVGFLHAFTPGHGKALVGAFLIANQGTVLHALFLGLIITVTHTVSIYAFGLLASTAAAFFLPGEFIPILSTACGIFIVFIGLRGFVRRVLGRETDHAHLLPNLQVLRKDTVNILIDGRAAEANEALMIAVEDEGLRGTLKAAGAEDFNLCSPGCSTHGMVPLRIRQRQNSEFFRMAVKTGAVDGVVTASPATVRHLGKLAGLTLVEPRESVLEKPERFLSGAVNRFSSRGDIRIPETRLSWGRVISLGIAGGIIPCPDALAVLLVAIAAGRLYLGMGIIVLFSAGLAAALIGVGMAVVLTKRIIGRQRRLGIIVTYIPYFSSLFISALGVLMILGSR